MLVGGVKFILSWCRVSFTGKIFQESKWTEFDNAQLSHLCSLSKKSLV